MYDHIGLKVKDVEASVRFYAALAPFGDVLCSRDAASASFDPAGESSLWLLRGDDRAAVDGFHADGVHAGGRDNGRPGVRADYSPMYYAAFLLDPDGNNVEAVCTR